MLSELSSSQKTGEPKRRWFRSERFDLIVWMTEKDMVWGFQLCYGRGRQERALTWTSEHGYSHDRIDDGEGNPTKNQTPILVPDGVFPAREILAGFTGEASAIDSMIRHFVVERLVSLAERSAGANSAVPADAAKGPPRG
jgi:hypothetical protein